MTEDAWTEAPESEKSAHASRCTDCDFIFVTSVCGHSDCGYYADTAKTENQTNTNP